MSEAIDQRREIFCREYIKHLNGAQAARDIGIAEGSARSAACRMLAEPAVQDRIAELMAERSRRAEVKADDVLARIFAIATADPNELIEHRRTCCRYCWGVDHRYQFASDRELKLAERAFNKTEESLVEPFDHGGTGFNSKREPNAECPECAGEGVSTVFVKDTRLLSPSARALYGGVKITKDGLEIKVNSQDKHLELLARHLGLIKEKVELGASEDLVERLLAGRKRVGG